MIEDISNARNQLGMQVALCVYPGNSTTTNHFGTSCYACLVFAISFLFERTMSLTKRRIETVIFQSRGKDHDIRSANSPKCERKLDYIIAIVSFSSRSCWGPSLYKTGYVGYF